MTATPTAQERALRHVHEAQPPAARRALRVLRHRVAPHVAADLRARVGRFDTFVIFAGYPSSGHTLVGSILNSHPNCVVANELDALFYLHNGVPRDRLVSAIVRHEIRFERRARRNTKGYSYKFPGDRVTDKADVRVLGDKKGFPTARRLAKHPWLAHTVSRELGVPIKVVHVARDPADLLGSFAKTGVELEMAALRLREMANFVQQTRRLFAEDAWHTLHFEDLIAEPRTTLAQLLHFLDLEADAGFLDGILPNLFATAPHPGQDHAWSPQTAATVAQTTALEPAFRAYAGTPG